MLSVCRSVARLLSFSEKSRNRNQNRNRAEANRTWNDRCKAGGYYLRMIRRGVWRIKILETTLKLNLSEQRFHLRQHLIDVNSVLLSVQCFDSMPEKISWNSLISLRPSECVCVGGQVVSGCPDACTFREEFGVAEFRAAHFSGKSGRR